MGVLTDCVPAGRRGSRHAARFSASSPGAPVPSPGEFSPASVYFRFYVARALDHAGMDDLYLGSLGPWRSMLDIGLTTFAETAEPTRSDDHGRPERPPQSATC